jgi:hypothetical protein
MFGPPGTGRDFISIREGNCVRLEKGWLAYRILGTKGIVFDRGVCQVEGNSGDGGGINYCVESGT